MIRKKIGFPAAIALCCALAGAALAGCDDDAESDPNPEQGEGGSATSSPDDGGDAPVGTETITVGEYSVNVSCSGEQDGDRPVIILLHGMGDDLTAMADFQQTLSASNRVCSYDRLGAGASDQPAGPQELADVGETLTGVIDHVAGDAPVVLAGHSAGGLIAGRYAPEHQDRVQGLVLLDATSPTAATDLMARIPESATGEAGELRAQTLAVYNGENPEQLRFEDGEVASAGDIPVRVIQHGQQYLAEVPEYGEGLEEDWTKGQRDWLNLSSNSELITAENSGHYIYVDEPEVAVDAVEAVVAEIVS